MYFEYETDEHCIKCGKPKYDGNPYCEECALEEATYLEDMGIQ